MLFAFFLERTNFRSRKNIKAGLMYHQNKTAGSNTKSLANGFEFEAAWYGGRCSPARQFLKNQGFPVFQKLWRKAFNLILNATWYKDAAPGKKCRGGCFLPGLFLSTI
jgi:hypothetical protein